MQAAPPRKPGRKIVKKMDRVLASSGVPVPLVQSVLQPDFRTVICLTENVK